MQANCFRRTGIENFLIVFIMKDYLLIYSTQHSPSWEANGSQLVKKFPAFYGTQRFITAFTNARKLSLSRARSIQSMHLIPLPEDPP